MSRIRLLFLLLALAAVFPAAAAAQGYPAGRLVDPAMISPPESIPPGPVGEYPEDWGKCVAETNPTWPTAPRRHRPEGR